MELTRPLRQLNMNCDFRKKYDNWCRRREGVSPEEREKMLTYQRANNPDFIEKTKKRAREKYNRIKNNPDFIEKTKKRARENYEKRKYGYNDNITLSKEKIK